MRKSVIVLLLMLLCATGCGKSHEAEADPVTSPTDEIEVISAGVDHWSDKLDESSICIQFQPTAETTLANVSRFYIPEDQQKWQQEFETAVNKADLEKHWVPGDSSYGIFIHYQGDEWELLASGELQAAEFGRVRAEDAAVLYDMCMIVAGEYGMDAPVRPADIQDIASAVLEYQGTHCVTNPDKLAALQDWLSGSTAMRGGTNCPLEAMLTLTMEDGTELKLRVATDSCCVWMSEGVYYRYGVSDNREFLAFFAEE